MITLDYAAQKDILHNKFKAQSFFKKWFERNVLMTIKTKHMIPENTEKFTINDDTTVTCLLKVIYNLNIILFLDSENIC